MSSANFFSMLEDNSSSDVVEIAKKRQVAQQQKPVQPKEAKEKAPATTGDKQQQQKPQQGAQQGEKTQSKPQTGSQENRGRGRGQRPQTTGGERSTESREGGRGRGRGRPDRPQGEGQQQRRVENRDRPPRVRREEGAVSAVDTTTEGGEKRRVGKQHTHDPNQPRRGRQFDRSVSGTGRGRGLKKGGEGAHNWGKEGDQDVRRGARPFQDRKGRSEGKVVVKGEDAPVEGVTAPLKDEAETVETPTEGEPKTEGAAETKVEEEKKKEEEVDNTLTLEEYQRQQQEKRKNLPNFRPETAPASTSAAAEKKKKEKKDKTSKPGEAVSIQEFLKDRAEQLNAQRESERDSRGRGRGPRGSGRGRGSGPRQPAPNVKDEKAFPSLSGK